MIRAQRAGAALVIYCTASALLIARHGLADPSHVCVCIGNGDPGSYMWGLRWWPYALTHGLNPLYTHLAWSPTGANVAAAPLIPLPSMLAWPLTATIGLLPTYDVMSLLSPALAAATAYLLCDYLTGEWLPSFAGGWVFGFSSYELSQLVGHAMLMLIALLPLAVLLVLVRLDGRIGHGRFVVGMALLFAAQLLTSTEVLASGCGFGALALVLAWLATPSKREALFGVATEILAGGLLAALITSPFLYEDLISAQPAAPVGATSSAVTDLAGLVVPTSVTWLRYAQSVASKFPGNVAEQGAYLGGPLVVVFCWSLWERRRSPSTWVLAGVAAVALLLSLGPHLHVAGHSTIPLPAIGLPHLPIARAVIPDRLIVYAWLALAVALALWLARPGRWLATRWVVAIAGIVLILPDGSSPLYRGRPDLPALLITHAYKRVVRQASTVLILPYGPYGPSMLWQAESGFWFKMPEGALTAYPPPKFGANRVARPFFAFPPVPVTLTTLRAFLREYRVSSVLVDAPAAGNWPAELAAIGLKGRARGGVIVYDVSAPAAAAYSSPGSAYASAGSSSASSLRLG